MPSVRFGDLSHLYWNVTRAMDNGNNPSVQEIRNALDARDITNFLDQYSGVDLSPYGNDPFCSQDELDAVLEQWSAADATDLSLSPMPTGLLTLPVSS